MPWCVVCRSSPCVALTFASILHVSHSSLICICMHARMTTIHHSRSACTIQLLQLLQTLLLVHIQMPCALNYSEPLHLATCRTGPVGELESPPPKQSLAGPAPHSAQSAAGHTAHPDCSFSGRCWSGTAAAAAAAAAAICELCTVAA